MKPGPRQKKIAPVQRRRKLRANVAEFEEGEGRQAATIPTRWVKMVVAIFLLPVCYLLSLTFFELLGRETIHHRFWLTEEFWFFGLGGLCWLIIFFGLPRPIIIYVFGHELTHAIWVWIMGGRVSHMSVTGEGGHILTDKKNVWISLAPYFFPIYTIFVIVSFGAASLLIDLGEYRRLLFALVGLTWTFHLTFTFWIIPKEQPDLTDHGTFFSLVVIYLMNLIVLTVLFIAASPGATFAEYGLRLTDDASDFSRGMLDLVSRIAW